MTLYEKMTRINKTSEVMRELIQGLNGRCSEFAGVAAVIPDNAPYPLSNFKGCKVILHTVTFDYDAYSIKAVITLPYSRNGSNINDGRVLQVSINKDWFINSQGEKT